jgi:hypothetical protein
MVKRPGALCHRAFVACLGLELEGSTESWTSKVLTFLTTSPALAQHPPGICRATTSLRITPVAGILEENGS